MTSIPSLSRRAFAAVALGAGAALLLAGCGGGAGASSGGGGSAKVAALIAGTNISYLASYEDALKKNAKKAGLDLTSYSADFDASKQAQQFTQAIASKPKAIILVAVDTKSVVPSLLKAKQAGIPVIVSNAGVDPSGQSYTVGYTGPDETAEAKECADLMVQAIGKTGNVIVLEGALGSNGQILRDRGFVDELKKIAPGIRVLDKQTGNWDQDQGRSAAANMLTRFGGQVDGIFAHNDPMAAGAVQAMADAGASPDIKVVGLGGSTQGFDGIKNGTIFGTVIQSPVQDAVLAVKAAVKVVDGKKIPKNTYLTPVKVTKDNVDEHKADW